MSEVKNFNLALLAMDVLRGLSKHLSLILVALAAVIFYFAGAAFAEGNFVLGIVDAGLGVGNIVILIQLRCRIAKSRKRSKLFLDSNDRHVHTGV